MNKIEVSIENKFKIIGDAVSTQEKKPKQNKLLYLVVFTLDQEGEFIVSKTKRPIPFDGNMGGAAATNELADRIDDIKNKLGTEKTERAARLSNPSQFDLRKMPRGQGKNSIYFRYVCLLTDWEFSNGGFRFVGDQDDAENFHSAKLGKEQNFSKFDFIWDIGASLKNVERPFVLVLDSNSSNVNPAGKRFKTTILIDPIVEDDGD